MPATMEMSDDERPHIPAHCYDDESSGIYYRQFRRCSNGEIVAGVGATEQEATRDAALMVQARNEYLAKPDLERLAIVLTKTDVCGYLCQRDLNEAVQIIGRHILNTVHIYQGR